MSDETRVPIEECAPAYMQLAELQRRYDVQPDWKGRPSLSLKDAAAAWAECQRRADHDARVRQAWLTAQGDWERKRAQVRMEGSQAAVVPAGVGDAQATAMRIAAGNAALRRWDAANMYPGSTVTDHDGKVVAHGPASEFEWFERTGGRL